MRYSVLAAALFAVACVYAPASASDEYAAAEAAAAADAWALRDATGAGNLAMEAFTSAQSADGVAQLLRTAAVLAFVCDMESVAGLLDDTIAAEIDAAFTRASSQRARDPYADQVLQGLQVGYMVGYAEALKVQLGNDTAALCAGAAKVADRLSR